METNQVYQDITTCIRTILPTVLGRIVTEYCLHPIGKRLYDVESAHLGFIYNLQWCENGLLYEIHYILYMDWEDCCGSFTKEEIEIYSTIKRCFTYETNFYFKEQYLESTKENDFWVSMPPSSCSRIVNGLEICVRCGRWICDFCFTNSKELLGTMGDINAIFSDQMFPVRAITPPFLQYCPPYGGCFGHVRICIYCKPSFPTEQYEILKNTWRTAMSDIEKKTGLKSEFN